MDNRFFWWGAGAVAAMLLLMALEGWVVWNMAVSRTEERFLNAPAKAETTYVDVPVPVPYPVERVIPGEPVVVQDTAFALRLLADKARFANNFAKLSVAYDNLATPFASVDSFEVGDPTGILTLKGNIFLEARPLDREFTYKLRFDDVVLREGYVWTTRYIRKQEVWWAKPAVLLCGIATGIFASEKAWIPAGVFAGGGVLLTAWKVEL